MTTTNQDAALRTLINEQDCLTAQVNDRTDMQFVIDWIAENMEPDEVFSDDELAEWAEDNGYEKVAS
jgi:light-regulated signal transduction histidine kinase (bacteriophytochrome)